VQQSLSTPHHTNASSIIPTILSIADSGSTDFLLRLSDLPTPSIPTGAPIVVAMPNGSSITHLGAIDLVILQSNVIIKAHIFSPNDLHHNLSSMAQLCALGCTATFTDTSIKITDSHGTTILCGTKKPKATL